MSDVEIVFSLKKHDFSHPRNIYCIEWENLRETRHKKLPEN